MILSDFHMHTTFCDGTDTPEEMVLTAIDKGMTDIGISIHSYTFFDESCCSKEENVSKFVETMNGLKHKYADKIGILCGVEQDYYSTCATDMFDYVIGSVHYLKSGDKYYPLDLSAAELKNMVETVYGGDFYLMAEDYYNTLSDVVEKTGADIIGHLDLITKFNEEEKLFDIKNKRYFTAAKKCIDKLITYGIPFEINTGAISRGYRTTPYPDTELIDYIKQKGGRLILSSDAHSANGILHNFEKFEHLIK